MQADHTIRSERGLLAGLFVKETVLILAAAVLLPFAVHFIPAYGAAPWGARLLPLFLAPFLGVFFFRLHVGLVAAVLAPALLALLTGLPAPALTLLLTLELVLFTLLAHAFLRRRADFLMAAPLAYLLSVVLLHPVAAFVPFFAGTPLAQQSIVANVATALPGLALLLLVNAAAVALQRRRHG